jgi:amidase
VKRLILVAAALLSASASARPRDMTALAQDIADGRMTSAATVEAYLLRIATLDAAGPRLGAVIATLPDALEVARRLDAERKAGRVRGPLHGVPLLLKDNIEAAGPVPTTAGSLALKDNVTDRDAPLVARLRAAGAVILGKTNLSEWANFRSTRSTSGWSAVGGLTRNPHVLDRNPCGSSSGSGVAVAAQLAAAAIGTETDGSIVCPAGINGIVGFKPTLGLVSRTFIVPLAPSQDTAGPMTASVRDAALIMNVIAGSDPADPATVEADSRKLDYVAALSAEGLKGLRVGVLRDRVQGHPGIAPLFKEALATIAAQGAEIVDIADSRSGLEKLGAAEYEVLLFEFKAALAAYLPELPPSIGPNSLANVIAFNRVYARDELRWFDQDILELAETRGGLDDPAYREALALSRRLARQEGIDRLLLKHQVDLLIGVTNGPAWKSDLVNGDSGGGPSVSQLPAVAGYPHLTVPMGAIGALPVGISFIGAKWADAKVLAAGHAYEQASRRRIEPRFLPSLETPQTDETEEQQPRQEAPR